MHTIVLEYAYLLVFHIMHTTTLLVLVASIVFILEYSMHNMQNNYYSLVVLVL